MTCRICGSLAIENRSEMLCASCARNERKSQREMPAPKKRAQLNLQYWKIRKAFLKMNPKCERCSLAVAKEVHHKQGRLGDLLIDASKFMAVCHNCHRYIEEHSEESYRNGWSLLRTATEPHAI